MNAGDVAKGQRRSLASRMRRMAMAAFAAIGALTVIMMVLLAGMLLFAAVWWPGADDPVRADAIFVLAGAGERPMYAADLYRQGYGDVVYVSRPAREPGRELLEKHGTILPTEEDMSRSILTSRGVPADAVRFFSGTVASTIDEAHAAFREVPDSVRTMLVVTSHDHARRARLIFRNELAGRQLKVVVLSSPYDESSAYWWTNHAFARQVVSELAKTLLYAAGIRYSN